MYDRAPRELVRTIGSTPATVGPGSYDGLPARRLGGNRSGDGYAPFSSMTSRDTFLTINEQVTAAPGPGQYDLAQNIVKMKGGKDVAGKAKRFSEKLSENPGPGAYEVRQQTKSAPEFAVRNAGGSLVQSRIMYNRKAEAPSIPTPGQAYGYEENDDGQLRKQPAPNKDKSLGPAYYNPKQTDTRTTKTYRGTHFGAMTSKRHDFTGKVGPGPGEYEPFPDQEVIMENTNICADKAQFQASIPRYHDAIAKDEIKKATPGPGKYDIQGQFREQQPQVNTEGIEVEHPPFMSQAKRFTNPIGASPAPGTYNDPRNALEITKRISGMKHSPFGQTSTRFNREHHIKRTPGPAQYNLTGMGSESMRKAYIESTRRGIFGSSSVRTEGMVNKGAAEQPGPAQYRISEKTGQSRYNQLSSTFASTSSRLAETPSIVKEIPPPGSYEVSRSYEKSQMKPEHATPRTNMGSKKHGSFMSSASRFANPRDVRFAKIEADNPGPGTYQPTGGKNVIGGMMVTKDKRFKQIKSEGPGPGTYEFSPLIQDTVLKGTYNATLNNPVAPQLAMAGGMIGGHTGIMLGV